MSKSISSIEVASSTILESFSLLSSFFIPELQAVRNKVDAINRAINLFITPHPPLAIFLLLIPQDLLGLSY